MLEALRLVGAAAPSGSAAETIIFPEATFCAWQPPPSMRRTKQTIHPRKEVQAVAEPLTKWRICEQEYKYMRTIILTGDASPKTFQG
jgi:hypothetical protein